MSKNKTENLGEKPRNGSHEQFMHLVDHRELSEIEEQCRVSQEIYFANLKAFGIKMTSKSKVSYTPA